VPKVSQDALLRAAEQGLVEVFTLVHPAESNKYTSVNIYLDEVGMLKRLPMNTRASELASKAGFNPPPKFYGDVFLGRVKVCQMQVIHLCVEIHDYGKCFFSFDSNK
jgi:hypothetical protein